MKKGFRFHEPKNAGRMPGDLNLPGLYIALGILALYGVIAILLDQFGYERMRAREAYRAGLEQIRQGNIMEGRQSLRSAGDYRDAEKILEETNEDYAKILLEQGEYSAGYSLLLQTDSDPIILVEESIREKYATVDDAKVREWTLALIYALTRTGDEYFAEMEKIMLDTPVLQKDTEIARELNLHLRTELWEMELIEDYDSERLWQIKEVIERIGVLADAETIELWKEKAEPWGIATDQQEKSLDSFDGYHPSVLQDQPQETQLKDLQRVRFRVYIPVGKEDMRTEFTMILRDMRVSDRVYEEDYKFKNRGDEVVEDCKEFMDQDSRQGDVVVIFAHQWTDYTALIVRSKMYHIPLLFFTDENPEEIRTEVEKLLQENRKDRMPQEEEPAKPTPVPWVSGQEYTLNCPWPEQEDPVIYCIVSLTCIREGSISKAFREVLGENAPFRLRTAYVDNAQQSGETLLQAVQTGMTAALHGYKEEEIDAILVSPFIGAAYEEALQLATQKGIPVWIFSAPFRDTVREEILALYSEPAVTPEVTSPPEPTASPVPRPSPRPPVDVFTDGSYQLNLPWTQKEEPSFFIYFPEKVARNGYTTMTMYGCFSTVYGAKRVDYVLTRSEKPDRSVELLIREINDEEKQYDGILVFPHEGVDYWPVVDAATEKGIPIWFFSSIHNQDVKKEFLALYE